MLFHRTESLDFGILHSGEVIWYVYCMLNLCESLYVRLESIADIFL